jgi:hypothetical protein
LARDYAVGDRWGQSTLIGARLGLDGPRSVLVLGRVGPAWPGHMSQGGGVHVARLGSHRAWST